MSVDWRSELINLGFFVAILAAGYLKILPQGAVDLLASGLVGARLALLRPPSPPSGGGGGAAGSGGMSAALSGSVVGAIALGLIGFGRTKVGA